MWAGFGRQEMDNPNYFLTRGDWDQLNLASSMETKVGIMTDRLQAPVSLNHVTPLGRPRTSCSSMPVVLCGEASRRNVAVATCLSLHRRSG